MDTVGPASTARPAGAGMYGSRTRCAALELTGEARTYCDGEGAPGTKRARARDRAQGVLDFGTGIGVEAETGKAIPDGDGRARGKRRWRVVRIAGRGRVEVSAEDRRPPTWGTGDGPRRLRPRAPHCDPSGELCAACRADVEWAEQDRRTRTEKDARRLERMGYPEIAQELRAGTHTPKGR